MGFEGFLQSGEAARFAPAPIQAPTAPSLSPRRRGLLRARAPERRPERASTAHAVLAHDLNNLLGVILNANEMLAEQLPAGGQAQELAQLSQDAAERAANLIRLMQDLAAPKAAPKDVHGPKRVSCDAAEAVAATARLTRLSLPQGVRLHLRVAARSEAGGMTCAADLTGLEQALLNLCVNAGHAMPDGGDLTVCAEAIGEQIVLTVADTGCGMSPDVLARCTEAFFTTRKGCGGTGLGLAGVADFARRCGGRLDLASEQGRGTTATLVLPRA